MNFLSAGWLIGGLLAVGAVLWLHRLRPPRRSITVSSLYLWREVHKQAAANKKRRKLLASLILLAQIAALVILTLLLAGPLLSVTRPTAHVAILFDTSSSMSIQSRGSSDRYTEAHNRLSHFLSDGDAGRYTLIASTGEHLRYDGTSLSALQEAVANLPAPVGPSDWRGALATLATLTTSDLPLSVVLVTDGALSPQEDSLFQPLAASEGVYALKVGKALNNVGITEFTARAVSGSTREVQIMVRVANRGSNTEDVQLVVRSAIPLPAESGVLNELDPESLRVLHQTHLTLPAQTEQRILLDHTTASSEVLQAHIDRVDALPADDTAYLLSTASRPIRMLHVGQASTLLRTSIATLGNVRLDDTFHRSPPRELTDEYDLVLFYDQSVPNEFIGTALALRSGRETADNDKPTEITWWHKTHPLARFVEWESVSPGPAHPLTVTPGELVLLESTRGPLLSVEESGLRRVVRMAIPLERSDLPFRVAYPIFLHNVLRWASGDAERIRASLPLGSLPTEARETLAGQQASTLLIQPLNWPEETPRSPFEIGTSGNDPLPELATPGVYSWSAGGRAGLFATSLLAPNETEPNARGERGRTRFFSSLDDLGDRRLSTLTDEYDEGARPPSEASPSPTFAPTQTSGRIAMIVVAFILLGEAALYIRRYGSPPQPRSPER